MGVGRAKNIWDGMRRALVKGIVGSKKWKVWMEIICRFLLIFKVDSKMGSLSLANKDDNSGRKLRG